MRAFFGANQPESTGTHLAEIDEELLFHLRSRIEDNRAAGMNDDEAWDDARRRLGSYRNSVEECHEVRTAGSRRLFTGAIAAVLALFALGWLATDWRAKSLAAQQSSITQQLGELTSVINQSAVAAVSNAESEAQDLVTLVTYKGQPIKDADVLLILKTWPNNQYQQEPFHAKTDADGKAKFAGLIPAKGQFAVHAAVVHPNRALTSAYHLFKTDNRDLKKITPLEFELTDAQSIRFRLKDAAGKPLANAHVAPASRKSKNSGKEEEHLIYFDAAGPVTTSSSTEGEVTFGCFARGDDVRLYVTQVGGRAIEVECSIPKTGDAVDVTVKPPR